MNSRWRDLPTREQLVILWEIRVSGEMAGLSGLSVCRLHAGENPIYLCAGRACAELQVSRCKLIEGSPLGCTARNDPESGSKLPNYQTKTTVSAGGAYGVC